MANQRRGVVTAEPKRLGFCYVKSLSRSSVERMYRTVLGTDTLISFLYHLYTGDDCQICSPSSKKPYSSRAVVNSNYVHCTFFLCFPTFSRLYVPTGNTILYGCKRHRVVGPVGGPQENPTVSLVRRCKQTRHHPPKMRLPPPKDDLANSHAVPSGGYKVGRCMQCLFLSIFPCF